MDDLRVHIWWKASGQFLKLPRKIILKFLHLNWLMMLLIESMSYHNPAHHYPSGPPLIVQLALISIVNNHHVLSRAKSIQVQGSCQCAPKAKGRNLGSRGVVFISTQQQVCLCDFSCLTPGDRSSL